MQYLLIWSIGPVQDFIKTARKARDLWFGSWLLGELSRAAALACSEEDGLENLIFPAPNSIDELKNSNYDVPNRIVAVVSKPKDSAQKMSGAARARLNSLAALVMKEIERHAGAAFRRDIAMAQINDLLEFAWVYVPLNDDYAACRERGERLMAARKTQRSFAPPPWADAYPKSSLDGAREVVLDPQKLNPLQRLALSLKPNEGLSGVDFLKRVGSRITKGQRGGRIDSTTHIAARSYLELLTDRPKAAEELQDYLDKLPAGVLANNRAQSPMAPGLPMYDGGLLFPSRVTDDETLNDAEAQHREDALRRLLVTWRETTGRKAPSPYYAVLMADGDKLGAHINTLDTAEQQRALGRKLTTFAGQAREVVKKYGGQIVYAGGDDVLSLLPVFSVFAAADKLRKVFFQTMDHGPTLSAGICIGHHTSPLQNILEGAREAERYAKDVQGRNAWAIKQDKRSGAPLMVGGKWNSSESHPDCAADMLGLVDLYASRSLPRGLPYDLREAERRLPTQGEDSRRELLPLHLAETRRILLQKGLVDKQGRGDSPIERSVLNVGLAETANRMIIARNLGVGL